MSTKGAGEEGSSALVRAADYVEKLKHPDGEKPEYGDADLEKAEKTLQVDEETRLRNNNEEERAAGAGSHEPQEVLNQDG